MKIYSVNNTNFESKAKNFRLPVKIVKETESVRANLGYFPKQTEFPGVYVREYSNPEAETLFNRAMRSTNLAEKIELLEKMGDYNLANIQHDAEFQEFVNKLDKMI